MKILKDRLEFDEAKKDCRYVFLLLFKETQPAAGMIHDKAAAIIADKFNKPVWFTDVDVLSPSEKAEWFKADDEFTLLSASEDGKGWEVKKQDKLISLCLSSGAPSAQKIRDIFSEAG